MFFTREISRDISITCDFMCEISHITFMIHGYADDLQLYQHCLPTDVDMMKDCFSMCVERIMVWMSSNRLRLNASKTEILWLGSSRRLARTALPSSIVIDNCNVPLADEVKCLGVTIDSALTFSKHVSSLVRTCYFQLRQLRSIRKSANAFMPNGTVSFFVFSIRNMSSKIEHCQFSDIKKQETFAFGHKSSFSKSNVTTVVDSLINCLFQTWFPIFPENVSQISQ